MNNDIIGEFLKGRELDKLYNEGSFSDKMSVIAHDKGKGVLAKPMSDMIGGFEKHHNANPVSEGKGVLGKPISDMIGGFEKHHNTNPVSEQKFDFDPKVVETSYDTGYDPNATYGIPAQAGVPSTLESKLPNVKPHGFAQDAQEWLQDPVHMGIAGAGALGAGLLGYGAHKAFSKRKKTASWKDSFSVEEIVKIANNVDRVVANYHR